MKNLSWLFFLLFLGICDILQSHFLRLFYCDISLTAIILQGSGSHITNYIFCLVGFNTTQQYDVGTELNTIMHVFRMVSFKQVQVTVLHVNISWSAKKKAHLCLTAMSDPLQPHWCHFKESFVFMSHVFQKERCGYD